MDFLKWKPSPELLARIERESAQMEAMRLHDEDMWYEDEDED